MNSFPCPTLKLGTYKILLFCRRLLSFVDAKATLRAFDVRRKGTRYRIARKGGGQRGVDVITMVTGDAAYCRCVLPCLALSSPKLFWQNARDASHPCKYLVSANPIDFAYVTCASYRTFLIVTGIYSGEFQTLQNSVLSTSSETKERLSWESHLYSRQ